MVQGAFLIIETNKSRKNTLTRKSMLRNEMQVQENFLAPREKMEQLGPVSMLNRELIALMLGWGNPQNDVFAIAKDIEKLLVVHGRSIDISELLKIKGVGKFKAQQILACLELARRLYGHKGLIITNAQKAASLLHDISEQKQEHFVVMSLSGANELIQRRVVTVGLLDRSQVHPREVFADVLKDRAGAVIFAHNHPSGRLKPSKLDILTHERLEKSAAILGIRVLDHIIVSGSEYYSFSENNLVDSSIDWQEQ